MSVLILNLEPPILLKRSTKLPLREQLRSDTMLALDCSLRDQKGFCLAGLDEVGRGALAGSVVAAAVILPEAYWPLGLNDSKRMSPKRREETFILIQEHALSIGVGIISEIIINQINIRNATFVAMQDALQKLDYTPDCVLVDGEAIPSLTLKQHPLVKGDSKSVCIAAASVIAKVTRDRIMVDYHQQYPEYGFNENKGYGTPFHMEALRKHGPCPIHRNSFKPIKSMMNR